MDVLISALVAASVGFGVAYFLINMWLMAEEFRGAFYIKMLLVISIGMGLTGLIQQFVINPIFGLSPDVDKAVRYLIANLIVFPLIILLIKFFLGMSKEEAEQSKNKTEGKDYEIRTKPSSTPNVKIGEQQIGSDNSLWADALREYEKNRDEGLYARLYAENKGDENKVKAEYLSIKFKEFKDEELDRARKIVEQGVLDEKNGVMQAIKTNTYEVKSIRSSAYWLLWNGRAVVPSPKGNYGVYRNESLAVDSIDYFESYGQYKTKGLEFILSPEDLNAYQVYFGEKPQQRNSRKTRNPNLVDRISKRRE